MTNTAPVTVDDSYSVHAGQVLTVQAALGLLSNDSDPDGDTLTLLSIQSPTNGSFDVLAPDGSFTYTPDTGFVGTETLTYTIGDGVTITQGTLVIEVTNATPVLHAIADQTALAGQTLQLTLTADDPDLVDTLRYSLLGGPSGALLDSTTGVLTWTAPYLNAATVLTFTVGVDDGLGGGDEQSFDVSVDPALLQVSSVTWTDTGYQLRFNRAFDASLLNLYDGQGVNRGAADVVLLDAGNRPVVGSIVVDADAMGFAFVKTGTPTGNGLLATGQHTLSIDSRADALVDTHGRLLDGDNDGVAGGAFAGSVNVAASTSAVIGIGEFTRGAGQEVNLPASGAGIPVRIGNAAGASSASFTVVYDSGLLDITGAVSNLPGVTVTTDLSVAGQIGVQVTGISGLTAATTELVHLTANVPAGALARYGESHVLDLRDVSVNGGAMPVRDDDGLHVAAYLGDATGDGAYAADDGQAVLDAMSRTYTGFGAYPLADPVVVAGAFGNGRLTVFDVRLIGSMAYGVAQSYIPDLPVLPATTPPEAPVAASPQPAQAQQPAAGPELPSPPAETPQPATAQAPQTHTAASTEPASDASTMEAAVTPPPAPEPAVADVEPATSPQPATVAADVADVVPEMPAPVSSVDLSQYQPALDFVVAVPSLSASIAARQAGGANAWSSAGDAAGIAASVQPQTGRERDDHQATAGAATPDLRVRFDRRARLVDSAEWQDGRQNTWQQNWVSGRDAHVARKSADWRVVVSRV